jgi:hypothetical protein
MNRTKEMQVNLNGVKGVIANWVKDILAVAAFKGFMADDPKVSTY